jgi:hypothetical protein
MRAASKLHPPAGTNISNRFNPTWVADVIYGEVRTTEGRLLASNHDHPPIGSSETPPPPPPPPLPPRTVSMSRSQNKDVAKRKKFPKRAQSLPRSYTKLPPPDESLEVNNSFNTTTHSVIAEDSSDESAISEVGGNRSDDRSDDSSMDDVKPEALRLPTKGMRHRVKRIVDGSQKRRLQEAARCHSLNATPPEIRKAGSVLETKVEKRIPDIASNQDEVYDGKRSHDKARQVTEIEFSRKFASNETPPLPGVQRSRAKVLTQLDAAQRRNLLQKTNTFPVYGLTEKS